MIDDSLAIRRLPQCGIQLIGAIVNGEIIQ